MEVMREENVIAHEDLERITSQLTTKVHTNIKIR